MKKLLILFFSLFISTVLMAEPLPTGIWKTIDDVTKKEKALVEISLNADNQLEGRILKVFYEPGKENETTCKACKGDKKDKPLVGLLILEKMTQDKNKTNTWQGGTILDPKTGKVYRCQLTLSNDNNQLKVRGFIGISLLGRTQVWERTTVKT